MVELVEMAQSGDADAQSKLVDQVRMYVSLMADKNLGHDVRRHVGPSDVMQQTLMKMVGGLEGYRGKSQAEFIGWLNQIVKNEVRKVHRDLTRVKRDVRRDRPVEEVNVNSSRAYQPVDDKLTPRSQALAEERMDLFHVALAEIPEDYATVIRLRNLEQLPFKEVGERMGRSRDAVAQLWSRAIVRFEKELKERMG